MATATSATETTMTARKKPIDNMTAEQLERYAARLLTDAARAAAEIRRPDRGRWQRSKYTDAICNAGPDWHPGMPLPGIL